jgi:RpiB/LacA/LacB family sugar-phosphate isomerase
VTTSKSPAPSVYVGSDHAAVAAKQVVIDELRDAGLDVRDVGASSDQSVDYPDYAAAVAEAVSSGEAERGVLLCGSGIGMSIVANKFDGVRAALVHDVQTAELSRQHNDANILVLGGRLLDDNELRAIVRAWLSTDFEGGRHQRRLDKIRALERRRQTK